MRSDLRGYGYIQDYPAEGAYRDSRINRIWEGTNEINRMLIVDTLIRAAMKGELPLLPVIQQATQDLLTFRPEMTEPEGTLEKEKKLVSMAKKIGLLAAEPLCRSTWKSSQASRKSLP